MMNSYQIYQIRDSLFDHVIALAARREIMELSLSSPGNPVFSDDSVNDLVDKICVDFKRRILTRENCTMQEFLSADFEPVNEHRDLDDDYDGPLKH
jgi:hypothetical protein